MVIKFKSSGLCHYVDYHYFTCNASYVDNDVLLVSKWKLLDRSSVYIYIYVYIATEVKL